MRKLPPELENPIDNLIYHFVPFISKSLDNYNPNFITTLSLIFGLLGSYFYYHNNVNSTIVSFLFSYLFDCVDGFHARRKKQETDFGDKYDHISDILIYLSAIILFYLKNKGNTKLLMSIFAIFFVVNQIHFTLQESYQSFTKSPFLNFFNLKIKKPEKYLKYSRFIGCGTLQLILFILIFISLNN